MFEYGIIWSLVFGVIAGAVAGWIMKGRGFGFIVNIIIGLLGSVVGGWLYGILGFSADSKLGYLIMSILGAVVLLFVLSLFKKTKAKQ